MLIVSWLYRIFNCNDFQFSGHYSSILESYDSIRSTFCQLFSLHKKGVQKLSFNINSGIKTSLYSLLRSLASTE